MWFYSLPTASRSPKTQGSAVVGKEGDSRMERRCRGTAQRGRPGLNQQPSTTAGVGERCGEETQWKPNGQTARTGLIILVHISPWNKVCVIQGHKPISNYDAARHTEKSAKSGKKHLTLVKYLCKVLQLLSKLLPSQTFVIKSQAKWILYVLRFCT